MEDAYTDDFDLDQYDISNLWEELDPDAAKIDPGNPPALLNNQDYTLNSPLIIDEPNAIRGFLMSGQTDNIWYRKDWQLIKQNWIKDRVNLSSLKQPREFHKECAKLWQKSVGDLTAVKKFLHSVDDRARETFEVVQSYVKSWLHIEIPYQSRKETHHRSLHYCTLMLDCTKITWILNATTVEELSELHKNFQLKGTVPQDLNQSIKYQSVIFGEVHISKGYIAIPSINMIWNRPMLLMFKDTSTARFQTLFSIEHRQFYPYQSEHLSIIRDLYSLGDDLLQGDTICAYESFGMVEPIASLRLAEIARAFRPAIPEFPHFRGHVNSKISELEKTNPLVREFYNKINSQQNKEILMTIYGSFRHWGHPFIDYLTGLESLYKNVTSKDLPIDIAYAEILASDLAFKILRKEFKSKGKWFVDIHLMSKTHPLYTYVSSNTWPSITVLQNLPNTWHRLPLVQCWDIPEVVDPSLIYSDKTHSIDRDELENHLRNNPRKPIPTRKVLQTLLNTPATNWPEFLQAINDRGLPLKKLLIGLKAKEREIKWKGRFFALMSWELREYFVFTEYLIKSKIIPLFQGLTMADDQTTLTKKMLQNSSGQGLTDYNEITIANHIDYEKWNNFQRKESTSPVFRVMGQFFGMPNLFSRTHEFFELSLIYYRDRPDLLQVGPTGVDNRYPQHRVCWNGQEGGLEGLRQKGWSVLNLLLIERESQVRNTSIKILAQGDNQVICTNYKLNLHRGEEELNERLQEIVQNNNVIMSNIRSATRRIGLKINEDETLQSADLMLYGKVVVFRGNITCLEEKRLSRITCTSNDQLPSLGTILSTVSTNCLTIAHYSKSPLNSMVNYNWLGNLAISVLNLHNPALRCQPQALMTSGGKWDNWKTRLGILYLDPSLGGVAGMCLTRFHIRMFPDPVTESLSFWRKIYFSTQSVEVQTLSVRFGHPRIGEFKEKHFTKLLEDPTSLNIPAGLSSQNLIKDEIKKALLKTPENIKHNVIQDAVLYMRDEEERFLCYLQTIKPCFPRFLSEFKASTFLGMTDGILGLFENSKTIRNVFKRKFSKRVDKAIVQCEAHALLTIWKNTVLFKPKPEMWSCSSSHADYLRMLSWNRELIGTTVPHPCELLSSPHSLEKVCPPCDRELPYSANITVLIPHGIKDPESSRGPYTPYLGSSTNEHTSLIQSWEKDTDVTFIKKASNLRRAFNWFVDPGSLLGTSISNNLQSLIGEDPGGVIEGYQRTGSALHRFGCSRISSGGYVANSPVYGTRMSVSSDNFSLLGDTNYDFMYQSLMLYAQQTIGEIHQESPLARSYHLHIECKSCLRTILEPILESNQKYTFRDVSRLLIHWKPQQTMWLKPKRSLKLEMGNWDVLNSSDQSREVGRLQGLIFGYLNKSYSDTAVLNNLFPTGLRSKVYGPSYIRGISDGLYRAALIGAIHRMALYRGVRIDLIIQAGYHSLVHDISTHSDFVSFCKTPSIFHELLLTRHRIPPSYPPTLQENGDIIKKYLSEITYQTWRYENYSRNPGLWIFADFNNVSLAGILLMGYYLAWKVGQLGPTEFVQLARGASDILAALRTEVGHPGLQEMIMKITTSVKLCNQEVRHALKFGNKPPEAHDLIDTPEREFSNHIMGSLKAHKIEYSTISSEPPLIVVPQYLNPLISGLRIPQIATGSFLKVGIILRQLNLRVSGVLCGGDGSGGISSLCLRMYPYCKLIFNSLLDMSRSDINGTLPGPPTAIAAMNPSLRRRCVNLDSVWRYPTDLCKDETWKGFITLSHAKDVPIDLIILDMEIVDDESIDAIDRCVRLYGPKLLRKHGVLIIKTYLKRLLSADSPLYKIGALFHEVAVMQTSLSSSNTSEMYLVCQFMRDQIILLYPLWSSLEPVISSCYVFASYSEEFNRARQVPALKLLEGIPDQFVPDPRSQLKFIWESLSVNKLSIQKFLELLPDTPRNGVSFGLASTVLVFNEMYPINSYQIVQSIPVPSDQAISAAFAYWIGVLIFAGYIKNNVSLASWCQDLINSPFYVYFYQQCIKTGGVDDRLLYKYAWSLNEPDCSFKKKRVYLQHKGALMGSTIRYFVHLFNGRTVGAYDSYLNQLHRINKRWQYDAIVATSDILYPIIP